jgi:PAS domain-containing protein
MKRIDRRIIFLSAAFGVLIWGLDAVFDFLFFYDGSFLGLLLTDVPAHEIYIRSFILVSSIFFGIFISQYIQKAREAEAVLQNVFGNVIPICITSNEFEIVLVNKSYCEVFGNVGPQDQPMRCYESRFGPGCHTDDCPIVRIGEGLEEYIYEASKFDEDDAEERTFVVVSKPYRDADGKVTGIIESFHDITERKQLEDEKEQLIDELKTAMDEVKVLSGFLPICASCKKIRDDKGYWNQLEIYIRDHSEARFSHGICPDCSVQMYSEMAQFRKNK